MLVERRLIFFCTGFSAISTGMVMYFSTSSALLPGHWVIMEISLLVTSGNASMGISLKTSIPTTINATAHNKIKYLLRSENPTIARKNLVMLEKLKG